jgi:hypothetical protein
MGRLRGASRFMSRGSKTRKRTLSAGVLAHLVGRLRQHLLGAHEGDLLVDAPGDRIEARKMRGEGLRDALLLPSPSKEASGGERSGLGGGGSARSAEFESASSRGLRGKLRRLRHVARWNRSIPQSAHSGSGYWRASSA